MSRTRQRRSKKRANAHRAPKVTRSKAAPVQVPDTPEPDPHEPFPVETYKDAAKHLRRPFTSQAVKFKVQATWPKDAPPTGGLIVPYIDSRLAVERLNLVCPHLWTEKFEDTAKTVWCHLTIDGLTRSDVGEGYTDRKGLVSDSRKRAAVQFGVGVSLYASPKIIFNKGDDLKDRRTHNGVTLELTPAGERRARELYQGWLNDHAIRQFGSPLDHGDVEDAVGDAAEQAPEPERPARQRDNTPSARPPETVAAAQVVAEDVERSLAALLAQADPLQPLRIEADQGMTAIGAGPGQRHRTLIAATDERALKALVARIHAAADES